MPSFLPFEMHLGDWIVAVRNRPPRDGTYYNVQFQLPLVSIEYREFDIITRSFVGGAPIYMTVNEKITLGQNIRKHTQSMNPTDWQRVSEATQRRVAKAQQELREANAQAEKEATAFDQKSLPLGLYKIFWKDEVGSSHPHSLAAVGMGSNGDRWLAPVNWIEPVNAPSAKVHWDNVLRVERVEVK